LRSMVRTLAGMASVAVAGTLLAPVTGSAAETAFRIVDQTLLCTPAGQRGVMTVGATARLAGYDTSPRTSLSYGAAAPTAEVNVGVRTRRTPAHPTGAVWLTPRRCQRTKLRVAFTSRGLDGGRSARPTGEYYRCDAPAKVLVRIRAAFARPTTFASDPRAPFLSVAKGRIRAASLAITTLRGRKPLFFASVQDATGRARVFVAPSRCRPR
jgi:ABC-type amino acid transport substrate-binding protein